MILMASVREDGEVKIIKSDKYSNKTQFIKALRGAGYSVRFAAESENFDEECEKWHTRKLRTAENRLRKEGIIE